MIHGLLDHISAVGCLTGRPVVFQSSPQDVQWEFYISTHYGLPRGMMHGLSVRYRSDVARLIDRFMVHIMGHSIGTPIIVTESVHG